MYSIQKGVSQLIPLNQSGIPTGQSISLTIIGEDGTTLNDANGNPISNISLAFDTQSTLYQVSLTISASEPDQYIRLYFSCPTFPIDSSYYPQDARLESAVFSPQAEVVPLQYMLDYFIAVQSKLDPSYVSAMNSYLNDKDGLRRMLIAAQDDLEKAMEIYISERTITESRDNNFERFTENLWQIQVTYPPLNSLTSVAIMYGQTPIAKIGVDLFTFDRTFGLVEFLPLPGGDSSSLYAMLIQNLSGMGFSIMTGGWLDRIPNMFVITYQTGLIYSGTDPIEKEGIRKAICRRALIELSNIGIDPAGRKSSEGEGIDGVNSTISYNMDNFIKRLKAEEDQYIIKMQRKYGKNVNGVVV